MSEMNTEISAPLSGGKKVRRAIFPVLDRSFQIKVTLYFVLLILMSHLFLLALHYRNMNHATRGSIGKSGQQLELYLKDERKVWTRDLFLGVIGISITVSMLVFYLTQRVSGPIFAMSRVLEEVGKGNYRERVKLRDGDELKWFADKLNETVDLLESREKKT